MSMLLHALAFIGSCTVFSFMVLVVWIVLQVTTDDNMRFICRGIRSNRKAK